MVTYAVWHKQDIDVDDSLSAEEVKQKLEDGDYSIELFGRDAEAGELLDDEGEVIGQVRNAETSIGDEFFVETL